ncbi:TniQ family protein [Bacillus pseudomycoides]|uniref:TniQ family protein n=2 Tax=Bacillus pseudomycoides TaxID=64104 RepID=UPI000BEE64D8|nr:TniQ family protein [Bacillus pseudomycoides]PED07904.1 hypothetical protein COO19_12260 [Bacillus pseudomycoides]PEI94364.1 hypothetical protein CN686_16265 [Bacillus pseudomycoides]PEK15581.1 hypothetical protein CN693_22260 [Bacillus pseudomycoides]PEM69206.1 hypothetical protein CN619_22050 [Bacillus pseudomycoides]PEO23737.1 hypothetical protein CN542_00665 [Bacillus pseudomycoides]
MNNNYHVSMFEENQGSFLFSKRTEFYGIYPIGLGTDRTEGMVSYLNRLAYAHNVKVNELASYIIMRHPHASVTPNAAHHPIRRNNMSKMMGVIAESLEELNMMSNLKSMTMLPWRNFISNTNLFSTYKRWCPICLEECKDTGIEIYEPLIWGLDILDICPIHRVNLHPQCLNKECTTYQCLDGEALIIGNCLRCHQRFGVKKDIYIKVIKKDYKQWNLWVANNIAEMITQIADLEIPSNYRMYDNIEKCMNDFFQGDKKRLCEVIETDNFRIRKLQQGKLKLSLKSLLLLSYKSRVRLKDLIYYGIDPYK